ncbi:ABATE domain-containing protein [Polaromonas sp.]|uniref:CGNR zinc finger domain-containing protein n=1 Tax=Polaromonas sp. TaxID=1869339 RepID=UPI0032645D4A
MLLIAPPPLTRCIDFANTLYWRGRKDPTDDLKTLEDVLGWCERSSHVPKTLVDLFRTGYLSDKMKERQAFDAALNLREGLYAVLVDHAERREPDAEQLAVVSSLLRGAAPRVHLTRAKGCYWWALDPTHCRLNDLLSPILWSATDLLVSDKLSSVKRCANDECRYLFLDDSKSGNRRWCSMASCGNRAKARRHYHRASQADNGAR